MMLRSGLAFGGVLWVGTALAAGPYGSIHVGLWNGGAYTNESTGAFSHCVAASAYPNRVILVFGQNAGRAWFLGFANLGVSFLVGETFPVQVTFDGQEQFELFVTADTVALATGNLTNNAMLEQFRKSRTMVVMPEHRYFRGQTFQFNLNSTGQLVQIIANCVAKVNASGLANAGDFSILPPKPPAPATPAKSETTASVSSSPSSKAAALSKPAKLVDVNGTGFVVSTAGHIVTNNHVIDGCVGDVHGNLSGEGVTTLRLVSRDETNDLALLQASKTFKDIAIIRSTAIRSGESITAIGYPYHGLLTSDFTVSTGIVSSLSGLLNDTRFLQISAPIQPGNSGGLDSLNRISASISGTSAGIRLPRGGATW
jgi:S1-C subfamily serine protease